MPHLTRERHDHHVPVHVTVRAVAAAPGLRSERIFGALRALFARASAKGFRLVQFSVQYNHMHLIVEADDGIALGRGVQRLLSRAAMIVNALARRAGRLWRDRHHREPLTTPSQVRNALVYVLFNDRKHDATPLVAFDTRSSAIWFDGYVEGEGASAGALERAGPSPTARPWTWLARKGWRKRGLVRFDEMPRKWPRNPRRPARA